MTHFTPDPFYPSSPYYEGDSESSNTKSPNNSRRPEPSINLKCDICGKQFNNRAIMRHHITMKHKTDHEKCATKPKYYDGDSESNNTKSPKKKHEPSTSQKQAENRKKSQYWEM